MPKGIYKRPTTLERFLKKVSKTKTCWLWKGAIDSRGYAAFHSVQNGRLRRKGSHFSYQNYNGEVLNGLCVLHRCDNPKCVNPKHLFLGTQKDNMRDCWNKRRAGFQKYPELVWVPPKKSKCKYGHRMFGDNVITKIRGKYSDNPRKVRMCKKCTIRSKAECDRRLYLKNRPERLEKARVYRLKQREQGMFESK